MVSLRTLALALLAFLWSPSLLTAQSVLQFPRAISSSGVFTGLAVGNPNTTQASVTFVAYQADGTLLGGGAQNPVTIIIPAGGQYARLIPEIFGSVNFNGWIQATSSTSGLTGFFLNGNSALTDFDGAGSKAPGTDFILPIAIEDATARTEVTLVNVNPEAAAVTVTLYASDGRVILTKAIALAARSLERQTLVNLLGAVDYSAASHLALRANRPIIAHEVVADFQFPGTGLRRETAALSGHALTSTGPHVLPQFATGGDWTSVVGIVNGSNVAQDVTLTAYKEDGSLWSLPSNPKQVTLPGNGGIRETVENLFGFPSSTLNSGWIQVSPSQGPLATYIGYGNVLTPSFALVEGAEISTAARFSVFSQVAEGVGYYTGLTVVNPGPASADIEFYTLRADGSSVGRTTLTLAPNQKIARLFRELLPASFQQVEGWGFVRASTPVVAAVLFGSSNGYALASVPQQIPAGDFVPPAQTSGAITGVVRSGGAGLADVQVTLSGPVNTTITTESSGQFVFSRLPAGQYTVTASRIGALIVPTDRNVTIDRQNVDGVDFTAGAVTPANSPTIDFITPVSVFAGNSAVSIRVLGTNFTPASLIRVNNQPIPTTFISSVELRAVIPASSLTQPTILKLAAETPPPGGGVSSLFDFAVNPAPSNPLIEGSAAVGSFPAGVAIDAVRRRALIANESADSVTVLDLVTRQTAAEVRVGRSPGEGIDIHPGKDIALVANVGSNDVSVINLKTNTVIQTIKVGRGPLGLAVNPDTNRAYVVNADDNNITVINLDTLSAIGTLSAGSRPSNIAVNTRTNQAIVSNRGGNSVSVLSLASGSIVGTISVGEFPRGVAINPETNRGVVANAGGDSISILDLGAMTAVTVKAGAGPTGVAIHQATNSVLVTNSGVTVANPGLNGVSTVSVINLDTREEIASISAGSAAYGVGVDQDRQIAAISNFGSNNVTIIRIPNPVPKITAVEPKTFPTGGGSFVVTVRGTGFVPTSVMTLNQQALPTVFVSTIELKGVVSAAMVDQLLQVRSALTEPGKGTVSPAVQTIEFNIEVENPGPGGGKSPPPANPQTNQIQPQNPAPSLLSISPTQTQAGVADLTLTLTGNNFNGTSIINFGGTQFSPVSSSLQLMTIVVPKAQLVPGSFPISVTNPAPGGGLSALLSFTVNAQTNSGPTVTTVTPSSVLAGSGAVTVVVAGTGFISSTAGTLAGVAGVLSGGTMSFAVPASQTASVGTLSGLISNPGPGGGTATFSVNVLNPAPAVSSFTPTSAGVGASATSLQVTGTDFVPSSQVTFGGTPVATGFVSSSLLTATIPTSLLTAPGSFAVGVTNPAPGGGSAVGGNFTVHPAPTLLSISPAQGTQGTVVNVALTGTNFVPGATTIAVSGGGIGVGPIVSGGTVGLTTSLTIDPNATPGPRSVTVSTTGGTSSAVTFTVLVGPPTLSSISPTQGTQGTVVGVTLTGTGFVAGSTVSVNSADVTVGPVTVVGPTSLTTTFTISSTAVVGARSVTVSTTAGTSGAATFSVLAAAPTISSISPSSGTQGAIVGVTLTGTNFIAGSTVSINSADVTVGPVTVVNSSLITTTFTISPAAAVGTRIVTVFTSAGTSNAVAFSVGAGAPTLSSISPASGLPGAVVGVTLTGANFIAGSTVSINSADVTVGPVTVVNSTSITTTFTISPTAVVGARNVTVSNSGGTSGAVTFSVGSGSAAPTLSSISPASGVQGAVVGVTLTGTNFIAGSTVSTNSADVTVGPVTVVNSTSITTTFTISSTAVVGTRNVTVSNSGGTTGAVTFSVGAAAPTLSSISPASGIQGTVVGVTLTGTNFIAGSTVSTNSADVTVGPVTVVNSTSITTTFTISSTAVVGTRNVTVSNSGGTSGAVTFSVGAAAPTLSSISPASGVQGAVVAVTLTGTNFTAGTTVSTNSADVTVGPVTVVNSTSITTTFTISSTAVVGTRSVTVSNSGGTSGAVTFSVGSAAPTLSSINPASGLQGAVVGVTLTGTNFVAGSTVSTNSVDVTVGPVTVVNSTSITTTLTISSTAVVGARNVTVSNSGGTSGAVTFSVGSAVPTLSSINIPSGLQGDVVPVTLTGSNFLAGATVSVSGTGVTVSAVNVVNSTTLTATFTISSLAASGARNVTVTTGGGTSGAVTFTVVAGANLFTGFSAAANPGGVWSYGSTPTLGGAFTLYDSNAADQSLPPGFQRWYSTALGADPSVVRNNTGTDYTHTNGILFPSNMLHIHPGPNGQYSVVRWTAPATGLYEIRGSFYGLNPHPTTSDVHVRHNSSLDLFSANINNYSVLVPYNVIRSVVAGDTIDFEVGFGSNNDYSFDSTGVSGTITPLSNVPLPSLSAINPGSGTAGTTISVTLTGSNFVSGGTTVAVSGSGVAVGSVNVISTTSLTASLIIAPTAATGARSVSVTTTGGTSNAQTFTIDPPAPTLTSVSPAFGVQGAAVSVTLTGTNFIAGASVAINSADVTVGPVTVVSPTSITTTFTISSTAVPGILDVTVTTGGGTSNVQNFTVDQAAPISWWRGEGNVLDTQGNNNPSASNAVSFVPAVSGSGFTVASGGFIDIPPSPSLANQRYTLSAWARPNGPGPNNDVAGSVIINQNIDNTHALLVSWRAFDGRFFFQLGTADGASIVSQNSFPTGQFYLVTATYDGSTFKLFVNGNLEGQSAGARPILYSTNLWTIGAASPNIRVQNFPRTWNGVIDEVQVYSRALSTAEIQAIYFSVVPPTLTAISPSAGVAGQLVPVTLTGTNFAPGAVVNVSGTGVSAGAATVVSATSITTTLSIASGAASGTYNVTVTTPGGTTGPVVFTVAPTFPGSVFTGSVSTDWSNAANWLPGGVPTASTDVFVPASATRQPTLTANASVLNLTVENGATLNTAGFSVTVAGSVDAGTTITGTGTVIMSGTGTIKGTLPNVQVTGTAAFAAASTATINGNLTVSSGSLDLADATVTVTGNFNTASSGALKMQNPSGVLTVNGATVFNGSDTTGLLTAGTLNVKGNFSSGSSSFTNFAPSGAFLTVLNGTSSQTVNVVFTGPTSNRFQNLVLANTAGAVFSTNAQINGNFDVTVAAGVSGSGTLTIVGSLTTATGSAVTVPAVTLTGAMTIGGTFTPVTTTFVGTSQTIQSGLGYQNIVLAGSGTAVFSSSTSVPGNLTVSSGIFDLAGMTLTLGSFNTGSSGALKMQNPSGVLTVNGATLFNGSDTTGLLTAGTLNAKGNFSSGSSSFTNFAPSGAFLTVLNGTSSQTVNVVFTGPTSNRFQNLVLANTAGAVFSTNAQINGNFDVTVAAGVSGSGTLTIVGNLTTAAGSAVTVPAVTLTGAMTIGGTFTPTTTTFVGTSQTIQSGLGYQNIVLAGSGTAVFSSSTSVPGNLTVSSGIFDLSGMTLTLGSFNTGSSGALKMQNPSGVLTVNGATLFNGSDTTGLLTAGTLNAKGNFSSGSSSFTNFAASGTFLTVLNGASAQTVNVVFPGPTSNRFQNLVLANTAGAVFSTNAQINGNFDVTVAGGVSGSGTLTIVGNLTTAAGSAVTVPAVTLTGAMTIGGTFTPTTTTFVGTSQTIQSGLGYQNIVLAGSGTAVFSSSTSVPGNLTVSSGIFDLSGMTLTLGSFNTGSSGALKMQNPSGVLTVNGATLFNGSDTTGLLTAGTLNAKGNFSSGSSSFTNFAASGTFLTVLNGASAQTVNVVFPGPTSNRFQNLVLANTAGAVFSTNAQINGNFDVTVAGGVSGSGTLTIVGNLTTAAGSAVTVPAVTLTGAMTIGGTFTPVTTTFVGTSQTIQSGLGYQNIVLAGTGAAVFSSSTSVPGNLTVSSGSLDVAGMTLTLGSFNTGSSGALKMQNPSGVLTVNGATLFNGSDTTGLLTAGTLNAKGNFSSGSSSFTNFAASGTHLTVLNGSASQSVSTTFPGPTSNRFQNLRVANTAGAVFGTNTQVNGNFDVTVAAIVSGGGTITVVGNLATTSGSQVTTAGMTLGGAMAVSGNFTPQLTTFGGTIQTIQAGLNYQNVTITGTATLQASPLTTILGNLTVVGGLLDMVNGAALVTGNFTTTGGGRLKMQNTNGFLQVGGTATFDGGDTTGLLTGGTFNLLGNFSSTTSSFTNFAPSGTHLTMLSGTATQTVNVAFSGTTNNRFRNLLVTNTVGVSLSSNLFVTGDFQAGATSPKVKIIGNGKTLTVSNIDAYGLDLDHVLLVINWNLVGPMYFDYVDLRNYPDAATRITITATAVPNTLFSGINFVDGIPTVGRLVNATDTNGGRDFLLEIESNLNPTLADAKTVENGGATVNWIPLPVTYFAPVNYAVGTFSRSVDKGDFNGDGKLDLAVANRTTNNVSILLGNGNGTFQTAVNYPTSSVGRTTPHPRFVKVADFNLDGKADLAVANEDTDDISILLGNGNGTFQTAVHYATDDGPSSIAVGDFNGDGKPDLVVTNGIADLFADTFSILLGNGNGTFQAAVTSPTGGEAPRSVVVADFNGDGKQDLATANGFDDNLSVYLGNGNGTFQTAVNYAAGLEPYSLVTADFNSDGKADLAVANRDDNTVKVYFGNGNGTFQAGVPYLTGTSPQSLTVADFNGDGVADLATADCGSCNQGSDTVTVLLGYGDGTFQFPLQFPAGSAPFAVVGGDFNGDGKPDLAVANRGSNNVSILLWTSAVP